MRLRRPIDVLRRNSKKKNVQSFPLCHAVLSSNQKHTLLNGFNTGRSELQFVEEDPKSSSSVSVSSFPNIVGLSNATRTFFMKAPQL